MTLIQDNLDGFELTGETRLAKKGEYFREGRGPNAGSVVMADKDFKHVTTDIVVPVSRPTAEVAPPTILVSFPGEDGTHDLTVPEAYALFRSLERALDKAGS